MLVKVVVQINSSYQYVAILINTSSNLLLAWVCIFDSNDRVFDSPEMTN